MCHALWVSGPPTWPNPRVAVESREKHVEDSIRAVDDNIHGEPKIAKKMGWLISHPIFLEALRSRKTYIAGGVV